MCTLSWKPTAEGYLLFFNRDEQRSRPPALPPALHQRNGVAYLCPLDPLHNGTWLLTNAHGLTLALLNHYPPRPPAPPAAPPASRGRLPLACADCTSAAAAVARCARLALAHYPPFHFVAFDRQGSALLSWDGQHPQRGHFDPGGAMLTTSSFEPGRIRQAREATYARLAGDPATATPAQLEAFHQQRGGELAASIRMARDDACTHSISRIVVSRTRTDFRYAPQPELLPGEPCLPQECALQLACGQTETTR